MISKTDEELKNFIDVCLEESKRKCPFSPIRDEWPGLHSTEEKNLDED